MPARTIRTAASVISRIEGEAELYVKRRGGVLTDVTLRIFEPPRFFEGILRGRSFTEAPDITARICGICPVAYQMSAVQAMEDALGVVVDAPIRALRRLLYCGEWIESHALHIFLLHAPDFLGYDDGIAMARDHPGRVECGLRLKQLGNAILTALGGRSVHPVTVRVGGFYRVPRPEELAPLAERLKAAREDALGTVRWVAGFTFPACEIDQERVALRHPSEYPMYDGRLVSDRGLDIAVGEYDQHFSEEQVAHSTALHALRTGRRACLTGPMARFALNAGRLSPLARDAAHEAGLESPCVNPFRSIVVRAVELLYACDEALRLIETYEVPARAAVPVEPRGGIGYGCTEAPRGILYHRYRLDDEGVILDATIVPPTVHNLRGMEEDIFRHVQSHQGLPENELMELCERVIRNYDPCISCATHTLRLHVEDEDACE